MKLATNNQFLTYIKRGGAYDFVQIRTSSGWGSVWTLATCDVLAAERASWMLRKLSATSLRHARRAKLYVATRGTTEEVAIITDLPSQEQSIWRLIDGRQLLTADYLSDECLETLATGLSRREHTAETSVVGRRNPMVVDHTYGEHLAVSD